MSRKEQKELVIIGGTGNGALVASTVHDMNQNGSNWVIAGFLNDHEESVLGYPVLGKIEPESITELMEGSNTYFSWALFSPENREPFAKRLEKLGIPASRWATLIHPTAVVSVSARLGHGVCLHPQVNVGPEVVIGNQVTLFSQSHVEHNARLADYTFVASNASIGAYTETKTGAFVGMGSLVREKLVLGSWSFVGMGAVVVRSVADRVRVVGNPAREVL